jgi:hypothetical protein
MVLRDGATGLLTLRSTNCSVGEYIVLAYTSTWEVVLVSHSPSPSPSPTPSPSPSRLRAPPPVNSTLTGNSNGTANDTSLGTGSMNSTSLGIGGGVGNSSSYGNGTTNTTSSGSGLGGSGNSSGSGNGTVNGTAGQGGNSTQGSTNSSEGLPEGVVAGSNGTATATGSGTNTSDVPVFDETTPGAGVSDGNIDSTDAAVAKGAVQSLVPIVGGAAAGLLGATVVALYYKRKRAKVAPQGTQGSAATTAATTAVAAPESSLGVRATSGERARGATAEVLPPVRRGRRSTRASTGHSMQEAFQQPGPYGRGRASIRSTGMWVHASD